MSEFNKMKCATMFEEADHLINETKQYDKAYFILQSIIELDADFGKAYNDLGWLAQWKTRDIAKAEEYYKKAIQSTPEYIAGYTNYISLLSSQQRWNELAAIIEAALKVPNTQRNNLFKEQGIMYEKQGKYPEAISAYKKFAMESVENIKFDEALKSIARCEEKTKKL
jgi:tetratricopeptide (TPR) repeat protein